jgi:hypothetical protein
MRGKQYSNEYYKGIARRYFELMQKGNGINTIAIMSKEMGAPRQRVSNWVFRAKEMGYLVRPKNAQWSSVKLGNGLRPTRGTSMTPEAIRKREERASKKAKRYVYDPKPVVFEEPLKVDDTPMPVKAEVAEGLRLIKHGDAYRLPPGLVVLATIGEEIKMLPTSAIVLI